MKTDKTFYENLKMKNKEILQKVIEKAINNKLKVNFCFGNEMVKKEWIDFNIHDKRYYDVIFSHKFAKAFWNSEEYSIDISLLTSDEIDKLKNKKDDYMNILKEKGNKNEAWKYHLQQMVLCKNPLEYLEKFV